MFHQYLFISRDPRRIKPLVDYVLESFKTGDFNAELSLNAVKIASFMRAFYEELGWRSYAWMDEIVDRYWLELNNEHDEIRAYIADALEYSSKVKVRTLASSPSLVSLTSSYSGNRNCQHLDRKRSSANVERYLRRPTSWASDRHAILDVYTSLSRTSRSGENNVSQERGPFSPSMIAWV